MSLLVKVGFDPTRLTFALRTVIAGWLALTVAMVLGLDSPQWAAMTAVIVAQPTRGMLLERSIQRVIGTIVGSLVGVLLIHEFAANPPLLVVGLAVWISLCAYVGNVLRQYRAYGVFLAGYTAAMIALLDVPHPDHVVFLATERVETIIIGIVVSGLVSGFLTPVSDESHLIRRVRLLSADTMDWCARALAGAGRSGLMTRERLLVSEMAAVEDMLDQIAAGSVEGHRRVRHIRGLLAALLSLVAGVRGVTTLLAREPERRRGAGLPILVVHLDAAAAQLTAGSPLSIPVGEMSAALAEGAPAGTLTDALGRLIAALGAVSAGHEAIRVAKNTPPVLDFLFHRDRIGARAAMMRAFLAVLAVGAAWQISGWRDGQFMVLSTCIMTTVFSSFENPLVVLRHVMLGSIAGAAAAMLFHTQMLPMSGGTLDVLLMVAPFLLLGGVAMAHRRTALASIDYNMCFLLLGQPAFPMVGAPDAVYGAAGAVLLGVAAAFVAFRFVFPISSSRRLRALISITIEDLEGLARGQSHPTHERWRARIYHRILHLVKLVDALRLTNLRAVDGGIAALTVGETILLLQQERRRIGLSQGWRRRIDVAMGRLATLSRDPRVAAAALERAVGHAPSETEADRLREAALALRENLWFFKAKSRHPRTRST
ncbi:FUSC family protein [Magnetospirillum molischianum]|uniref:Putative Fusaric acid resistance protein conserved region n=1 Tax=Magnetospirillum molischianum DSM 120 TaxID=1150626 RepID=H8FMP2_MAGML|nr:FUSC family protein [Magnetospirillum molischianum]CCG39630.1 putative Fusaric acid resistance protein conserved region [Magnetospirillum molischianum DSM 120]